MSGWRHIKGSPLPSVSIRFVLTFHCTWTLVQRGEEFCGGLSEGCARAVACEWRLLPPQAVQSVKRVCGRVSERVACRGWVVGEHRDVGEASRQIKQQQKGKEVVVVPRYHGVVRFGSCRRTTRASLSCPTVSWLLVPCGGVLHRGVVVVGAHTAQWEAHGRTKTTRGLKERSRTRIPSSPLEERYYDVMVVASRPST